MDTWSVNLRKIRKYRGLTQIELGEKSEIARSTIIAYEKGDAQPSMATFKKLADALEIPYQLFFVESDSYLTQTLQRLGDKGSLSDWNVEFLSNDSKWYRKSDMNQAFDKLNELGQIEAVKRVEELTEIPRYTTPEPE